MNRPFPQQPGVSFRVEAVEADDATVFAMLLQDKLNSLSDAGFHIVSMTKHGNATIITAQRHAFQVMPHQSPVPLPSSHGRTPAKKSAPKTAPKTEASARYHFQDENKKVQSKDFDTVAQAASYAMGDVETHERTGVLPVCITLTTVTEWEPADFEALTQGRT